MKTRLGGLLAVLFASILIGGCGGDDGDNSGILTIGIADAKPSLPVDAQSVYVTFDEVRVHKSGGGWESLPLPATPSSLDKSGDGSYSTHPLKAVCQEKRLHSR